MIRFSEILSKAVVENFELRNFLKTEALKTMDNDYDIFYPYSKNVIVTEGKSLRDILAEYAANEKELTDIEDALPLLTIYVPELPSGFDADTWDAKNEIPCVANPIIKNDSVNFYYDGEIVLSIKPNEIPGWPTLVVKNNERIRLKDRNVTTTLLRSSSYDDAYEFIDEAFNGKSASLRSGTVTPDQISPLLIDAYNEMGLSNIYWQRDYIYYGLARQSGTTGAGYLNGRFSEKIIGIKFTPEAYMRMADQPGDPFLTDRLENTQLNSRIGIGDLLWTEGRFEFKIDAIVNSLSGVSNPSKILNVSPKDLFDVQYSVIQIPITLSGVSVWLYHPTGVVSKEFNPNIFLIPWDVESCSVGWKFIISEKDEDITVTRTETTSAEYATNFGVTAGGIGKIGLNYGISSKRTQTNTYTLTTTQGSDELGTVEFFFYDPVVLSVGTRSCTLFSKNNPYVEMIIIPVPLY